LRPGSAKLVERSRGIVMKVVGIDYDAATALLERAGGSVKVAIVMERLGVDAAEARIRIERAGGFVGRALEA
jgi:N-acetylmuramic acid 6-phosphate etherase